MTRKNKTGGKRSKYAAKAYRNGADRYGQFSGGKRLSGDVIAGRLCFAPKNDSQ